MKPTIGNPPKDRLTIATYSTMKEDYFKDGESVVDSIFAEWETQIKKSKDENLNITFFELKKSFTKFQIELIKLGYKGYFSND